MGDYKLSSDKIGGKAVTALKGVEERFTEKLLEKDEESPTGYNLKTGGMAEKVTEVYQKIEDTVVGGYKKIENGFVEAFLVREDSEKKEGDSQSSV